MSDFDRAMEFVLRWEGGATITQDPDDPGGLTKYGISKRAHPNVDVAALTLPQAKAIYRSNYWHPAGCDELPWPLCLVVMDYAVHSGVSRADKAVANLPGDPASEPLLAAYHLNAARMDFLLEIARERIRMRKYLRGWMNRVSAVFQEIGAPEPTGRES